jgi:bifunctional DNase/RNase
VPPTVTEEPVAPTASAGPVVSKTTDDLVTPDGPTGTDATVAVTPADRTSDDTDPAENLDAHGPDDLDADEGKDEDEDLDSYDEDEDEDEDDIEDDDDDEDDEPGSVVPSASASGLPEYRMALVSSVTLDLPSQHPTVLLRESESPRRQLTFSIGLQDGIVLSHAMRRIPTPRPLTHELLTTILQRFDVDVVAVRLVGRQGAIYFAELDLRGRTGRSVLSARPSDALTLALLQPVPVPILVDGRLFETMGDVAPPA